MSVKVKICGLRTPESLDAALDAGADYFGLVFYEPSPRNVDSETARSLVVRARGRAQSVALMVGPDDDAISALIEAVNPDLIQLHGNEPPERVAEIKQKFGLPVIKAIRIATEQDARGAIRYDGIADMVLFDAMPAAGDTASLPGGNGVPFDWRALANMSREKRGFILSGGLDSDNVREAIAATGTQFVDVSSGVESAPGVKDNNLIRRFIAAARSTT